VIDYYDDELYEFRPLVQEDNRTSDNTGDKQ